MGSVYVVIVEAEFSNGNKAEWRSAWETLEEAEGEKGRIKDWLKGIGTDRFYRISYEIVALHIGESSHFNYNTLMTAGEE